MNVLTAFAHPSARAARHDDVCSRTSWDSGTAVAFSLRAERGKRFRQRRSCTPAPPSYHSVLALRASASRRERPTGSSVTQGTIATLFA